MGNYYVEKIECSLRSQWMDSDFIERLCIFIIIEHYYIRFRNSSHSERCGVGNLNSLVLCIHLACLLLAAIRYAARFASSFVAHRRHVALIAYNRELIFWFADRNTQTNGYAWHLAFEKNGWKIDLIICVYPKFYYYYKRYYYYYVNRIL